MNGPVSEYRAAQVALAFGHAETAEALEAFASSRGDWPAPTMAIPHPRTIAHQVALGTYVATDGTKLVSPYEKSAKGHPSWALRFGLSKIVPKSDT